MFWSSFMPARCTTTTSPVVPVEVFLYIVDGGPVAKDGFIDLSDTAPGFGLPVDANFKLTR